jgi:hypothetical protein
VTSEGDSYLEIAEAVLKRLRVPSSTQQIMAVAYLHDLVPQHLHGKTQHKTLGARLSEDILRLRQRSRFFRTRPGRFFLRSLIKDRSLPLEYRTPIVARRRRRELKKHELAYLRSVPAEPPSLFATYPILSANEFENVIRLGGVGYTDAEYVGKDRLCAIYSFVVVTRGRELLVHRRGNYVEGRRSFTHKKTIGFSTPVVHDDMTLFDYEDHGLVSAGLTALAIDLDIEFSGYLPKIEDAARLQACPIVPGAPGGLNMLGLVRVEVPAHFEPGGRRLAIRDLEWLPADMRRQRLNEFDPWSRYVLKEFPLVGRLD